MNAEQQNAALSDALRLLGELQAAFSDRFELISGPDELVDSTLIPGMKRVSILRFLADKIQCIVERSEAAVRKYTGEALKADPAVPAGRPLNGQNLQDPAGRDYNTR